LIRDISQYGNNGSGYGSLLWTGNGKYNGSYISSGPAMALIYVPVTTVVHPLNPDYISIFSRVKPTSVNQRRNVAGRGNASYRVALS